VPLERPQHDRRTAARSAHLSAADLETVREILLGARPAGEEIWLE
jgi:hypothetical protein